MTGGYHHEFSVAVCRTVTSSSPWFRRSRMRRALEVFVVALVLGLVEWPVKCSLAVV